MIENQNTQLYPIEISQVLNAGEIIFDRLHRGKAYFYLVLDSEE